MNSPRLIAVGLNEEPHNAIIADYRRLQARSGPAVTKELAALYPRRPTDLVVENVDANGIAAEWVAAPEADTVRAIFYLHGGGYTEGSPRGHRELVARLARTCGVRALVPEYRLAPAHPFPAALEDALAAYRWLARRTSEIVVMGDSAGGGLAVALMAQLGAQDVAARAGGLMSPWLDLTATALTRGVDDPFLSEGDLKARARLYAAGRDPADPRLSPLLGELAGLPPMIVQVGSREVLLNDAARFARAANAAGSFVELEVWDRMTHVWHQWGAALPAAGVATASLAKRVVELAGWTKVRSETAP